MLCLKKRRTYSFTQGSCVDAPRRSKKDNNNRYEGSLNMAITTLPRKNRSREERPSRMVLTVTEDTPADMLAGSMELLVQLPRDHHLHTQRVTVQRSTPMMDLLVQIATAHKLAASNYTLQAIGERGSVLPHQPNTPIGALDALQVKLLPKQSTFAPRKAKPANQPFETTFRLQVHLPRNQLYVSRVSPKMNLGEILEEVCREKNLDKNKYELRHPVNLEETLDLSLSLQDYHLQEVTLYTKQGRTLGSALSSQDIMALQRQEERRRQQAKQSVFGFIFKKSKENSLSTDSLEGRSVSPARSDETGRSASPLQPPARPQRKRRPAPKPPVPLPNNNNNNNNNEQAANECSNGNAACKDKVVISHSRNSSDSSGYHEASVLSDNPDSAARLPETLPRRNKAPTAAETSRKLAQTSQSSKSLGNIAVASGGSLNRAVSTTSLSSTGLRKKRAAPPPPVSKPLSSAISTQALERIDDSEESLTSDMDPSKPPSDIGVPSKASSDIEDRPKANSDIGVSTKSNVKTTVESTVPAEKHHIVNSQDSKIDPVAAEKDAKLIGKEKDTNLAINEGSSSVEEEIVATPSKVEPPRVDTKRGTDKGLLDTDALLQKVSDTLSNSLPATSTIPQVKATSNCALPDHSTVDIKTDRKDFATNEEMQTLPVPESFVDKEKESTKEALLKNNAENLTMSSQQDTSDYVSAVGDDLSITDWEYQLPAPPSAFRDTNSPVLNAFNTETLHSVKDTFKQSTPITHFSNSDDTVDYCDRNGSDIVAYDELYGEPLLKKDVRVKDAPVQGNGKKCDPKKEVISELENRIESGTLSPVHRETADSKKSVNQQVSTPKLAPVDNTLSNFIITTYARQKSVDIFEESSVRRDNFVPAKSTEEKVEERSNTLKNVNRSESFNHHQSRGIADSKKSELKISHQLSESQQKTNEMQRAKGDDFKSAHEGPRVNGRNQTPINNSPNNNVNIRKSKSIGNLHTDVPRNNDKFSQWRENILKRQEEPTKEKQLQSLQVLKSILPQLKNAQPAEENVSKNCVGQEEKKNRYDATSNERSKGDSLCESRVTEEADNKTCSSKEPNVKRYTYTGPPAISLGSWAERPSIKVQIKVDSDYKLGRNNAATGATTVVNLNQSKEREDDCHDVNANSVVNGTPKMTAMNVPSNGSIEREGKVNYLFAEKRETDELTRKLITHTTAAGFKKPTLNKVNSIRSNSTSTRDVDRPMVTQIELNKVNQEKEESREDSNRCVIDTTPLNFNELTKAFGQDVNCRAKPKRLLTNRHSDYYSNLPDTVQRATESSNRYNKNQKSSENDSSSRLNVLYKNHAVSNGDQNNVHIEPKKFTSIVGINSQNQQNQQNHVSLNGNVSLKNNVNNCRMNTPAPVVKGFKIQASLGEPKAMNASQNSSPLSESNKERKRDTEVPKAPTMPVIMGVTLKSTRARPKSMPITVDPRDMLLESIRNFGGREKLKNATERC